MLSLSVISIAHLGVDTRKITKGEPEYIFFEARTDCPVETMLRRSK